MCSKSCVRKVNSSLNGVDGIKSCKVDFESKTTTVVFDDEKINSDKIAKTITDKTYYKVKEITMNDEVVGKALTFKRKVNGPNGMVRSAPRLLDQNKQEVNLAVGNGS